ncbi:Uncharacterized protein TCM_005814 [Theobroma cacao]|uniref:Uncharacterized protein n=1 Tax=Theobroma cacao TaxID=3641 RepID=A0A061DV49_THECC|nr:Uncharacterized protein TCM_005814 [Theobroma cacao]
MLVESHYYQPNLLLLQYHNNIVLDPMISIKGHRFLPVNMFESSTKMVGNLENWSAKLNCSFKPDKKLELADKFISYSCSNGALGKSFAVREKDCTNTNLTPFC